MDLNFVNLAVAINKIKPAYWVIIFFAAILVGSYFKFDTILEFYNHRQEALLTRVEQEKIEFRAKNINAIQDKLDILRLSLHSDVLIYCEMHNTAFSYVMKAPYLKISAKLVSPKDLKGVFTTAIKDRPIDVSGITNYVIYEKEGCALISRDSLLAIDNSTWVSEATDVDYIFYHTVYADAAPIGQFIAVYLTEPMITEKSMTIAMDKYTLEILRMLYIDYKE